MKKVSGNQTIDNCFLYYERVHFEQKYLHMKIRMILRKLKILIESSAGECIKLWYRIYTPNFKQVQRQIKEGEAKVVVSLTSYGRRVGDVLVFSIYSLLSQTYRPDEIVLWLDSDNWNDKQLPKRLVKLKEKGLVTVKYCEDMRSFKKLIPTLEAFPNDIIITVDDDLYFRRNMVERLVEAHKQHPGCIITCRAHRPHVNGNQFAEYNTWDNSITDESHGLVFPTGGAGCLYKKEYLHEDICRKDLFMELTPFADDVWFYFMEVLKGTKQVVLKRDDFICIGLDNFYQYFHNHSSLASMNCHENQNDIQIRNVMQHYDLEVRDGKIVRKS